MKEPNQKSRFEMEMKTVSLVAAFVCVASVVSNAQAETFTQTYSPVGTPDTAVYAFTGIGSDVAVTFVGGSAADTSILEMAVNGGPFVPSTLNNQTSTSGTVFDFGPVAAGASITFGILNLTTGTLLTSNASMNADGLQHLWSFSIGSSLGLGFEDLLRSQSSDFDYNDFQAIVTGVDPPTATPLPGALSLFAGGIGALGLLAWRRKRRAEIDSH